MSAAAAPIGLFRRPSLPGLGLTLGVTLAWLGGIVLVPLAALALKPWEIGAAGVAAALAEPRVTCPRRSGPPVM